MPVLYYVRHGETDFNIEHRLQGQYETALNPRGREQARHCGGMLRDLLAREGRHSSDYGYVSSPLMRARETMQLVRATLGLDAHGYEVDDRLKEISYGEWEGSTLLEIEARDPHLLARREQEKWAFEPPGGESYRDVARRVAGWYAAVTCDCVVTAHGGVARALMANFAILPEEEATHAEVAHGVVYVFAGGTMARYA
ncbi:MAG: histidine phosphatase family protein [Xanthobacteraceae bacterium]